MDFDDLETKIEQSKLRLTSCSEMLFIVIFFLEIVAFVEKIAAI